MGDTSRYATHDRYLGNETLGEGLRRVPGTSSASPRHLFKCLSERGCCCELTKVCSVRPANAIGASVAVAHILKFHFVMIR